MEAGKTAEIEPAAGPSSASAAEAHKPAPNMPQFTRDQDLHAYHEMLLIRRFEEKAGQLYGMGLIGGFCHLYIGQEAVVVGMQMASGSAIRSSPATATMATCWPPAWSRRA